MDNSLALTIGGEIKVVAQAVGGKLFVFTPAQQQFLVTLQKLKNVTAAALSIGKTEEWGQSFLSSQKFRKYLNLKMKSFSDRNGMDVDWWYAFGKNLTDGFREFYSISCSYCQHVGEMDTYEAESFRTDDMKLDVQCPACYKPVDATLKSEPFRPSREQVEGWKTLGDRIIPKVERVHHQFESCDIIFEGA